MTHINVQIVIPIAIYEYAFIDVFTAYSHTKWYIYMPTKMFHPSFKFLYKQLCEVTVRLWTKLK